MKITRTDSAKRSTKATQYDDAEKRILEAINILSKTAKQDVFAKETIANLGVVLLDIRSHK